MLNYNNNYDENYLEHKRLNNEQLKLEIIKKYLLFFEKSNFDPQWGGYHCVQTYLDDCAAQCRKKFLFIKDLRISKNDLPHNFSLSEYILALDIFSLMPLGERHYFFKFIFTDIEVDDFDFAFARLPVFRVDQLRAHVQRYLIQ